MASPKVIDLDKKFGEREPVDTAPFHYLGKDWTLIKEINIVAYGLLQGGEDEQALGNYINYIVGLVIEDERGAWAKALANANLKYEALAALVKELTEVAAAPVPTESPNGSSGTPVTRVSRRRSTAS